MTIAKRAVQALALALVALAGFAAASPGSVQAIVATLAENDGQVCEALSSGKINTAGEPSSVTITAPDGYLISRYCVKAGSASQDDGGPVYVDVDPPAKTVEISHPSGKAVSHYAFELVPEQDETTTTDETTTETTTTTETETTTEETTTTTETSTQETTTEPETTTTETTTTQETSTATEQTSTQETTTTPASTGTIETVPLEEKTTSETTESAPPAPAPRAVRERATITAGTQAHEVAAEELPRTGISLLAVAGIGLVLVLLGLTLLRRRTS